MLFGEMEKTHNLKKLAEESFSSIVPYVPELATSIILLRHTGLRMHMKTKLVTSDSWSSLPKAERERRELAATRLKERLSSIPYYKRGAELSGDEYWARFYDSAVNT